MPNLFLYPGRGLLLRHVTGSTGNALAAPEVTLIPDGDYSELIAAHDCLELMFDIEFAVDADGAPDDATGDIVIEKVPDQNAVTAGEPHDTLTLTTAFSTSWNAGEALTGFFRIFNNTDKFARVYCQKRIA